MIYEAIQSFLTHAMQSDFFAGGIALGAFGAAAAILRVVWIWLHDFIQRRIWVSLTLDNQNSAYRNLCVWMDDTGVLDRSKHVRMTDTGWSRGTKGFAPGSGRHWFFRDGKVCHFQRQISDRTKVGNNHNQRLMETVTVTVLFGRVSTILGWIDAGRTIAKNKDRVGPGLHILKGDYWDSVGDIPRRPLDTVLVDDDRIERLVADMRWFYGAKDWYV